MTRLVKAFWYVSIFIFLLVLLWEYAYLPARVAVMAGEEGLDELIIGKATFFYVSLAVFSLSNIAFFLLNKVVKLNPESRERSGLQRKAKLRQDLADWMLAFASSINIFLILVLIYLGLFNNSGGVNLSSYGPVVFAGPLLLGLMLLGLVYIFFKNRD